MALGLAMGVEERPVLVAAPVRVESAAADAGLREQNTAYEGVIDRLGEKLIAAQAEVERLRALLAEWEGFALVVDLPTDYYAESPANVSAERLAEIEREVAQLNESDLLEVEVHDALNATVTPKRDDDYTEAGVAAAEQLDTDESYPDFGVEDDRAAAVGEPAMTTGTMDWPKFIHDLRVARGWTFPQLGEALGFGRTHAQNLEYGKRVVQPETAEKLRALAAETPPAPESTATDEAAPAAPEPEAKPTRRPSGLADPDYVHPDALAFIDEMIEVSDNPADYVATARISSTLTAWNTKTGKDLPPTAAFREIAKRFMRGKPIHQGKQVDGYYGMKLGGKSDGTAPFVPDGGYSASSKPGDERTGVAGAWKSPESQYIDQCVAQFMDANLIVTQDLNDWLAGPDLRAAYDEWAHANGKPDSDAYPGVEKVIGNFAGKRAMTKRQRPYEGKLTGVGAKPLHFRGVRLGKVPVEPDATPVVPAPKPKITPADLDPRAKNKRDVEEIRQLMKASTSRVEEVPSAQTVVPHGPDELAMKLAQLKHFGIGGEHGVPKAAAKAATADLHPTGREVWTSVPGEGWDDSELEATAYQLLVKCMNGLPDEIGFDYKEDVLATAGFVEEDVIAAVRSPQRVEIRPESWDKEKRYPILGFTRGDVQVIMGMRQPNKPRVIAAYWTSLLQQDNYRVNRHGGGGSKKAEGLPTTVGASVTRLRSRGCEIPEWGPDEKPIHVTYKGQDLGKITVGAKTKMVIQSDYQRCLRKMQAIDRREGARVG
jgi:transcriptional regulator with XRE-family HTH domain